jgi:hypothetical protein
MRKNGFMVGILAMMLVFGFAVVGCDNGTSSDDGGGNGTTSTQSRTKPWIKSLQFDPGIGSSKPPIDRARFFVSDSVPSAYFLPHVLLSEYDPISHGYSVRLTLSRPYRFI